MLGVQLLHNQVKNKAYKLQELAKSIYDINICIVNTLRTEEEQQAYFSQGREELEVVNAKRISAGLSPISQEDNKIITNIQSVKYSWHGYGLAFDIALVDKNSVVYFWNKSKVCQKVSNEAWEKVGSLSEKCGLEWSGTFKDKYTLHHYQDRLNLTMEEVQTHTPGKIIKL